MGAVVESHLSSREHPTELLWHATETNREAGLPHSERTGGEDVMGN